MCATSAELVLSPASGSSLSSFFRFIIYEKGIEDQVDIVTPAVIGGIKSREYLKLNCHGKVNIGSGDTNDCTVDVSLEFQLFHLSFTRGRL